MVVSQRVGQSIVGALVGAAALGGLALGFASMFKSQSQSARNLAAHAGITDLSHAVDLLLSGVQCATTGSFTRSGAAESVNITSGGSYSLSLDTIRFAGGTTLITTGTDTNLSTMIRPYTVAGIDFAPVGVSTSIATGAKFPFQMQIRFGSSLGGGPPPPPLTKYAVVYTDVSRRVVGACFPDSILPYFKNIQSYFADGTFVIPPNVTFIKVEACGAGGSGGFPPHASGFFLVGASGGGGGGQAWSYIDGVAPGSTFNIKVGAGGPGVGYNTNGIKGGDSSFSGSLLDGTTVLITATGGGGGMVGSSIIGTPGAPCPTTGSCLNVNYSGGFGQPNGDSACGGSGARLFDAPGGTPGGGGGGGEGAAGVSHGGGPGGAGKVTVWW